MIRNRLWYEMLQAKHNSVYICSIIGYQRQLINVFGLIITIFSTGGVMGWAVWDKLPFISCIIVSIISLAQIIQPQLIPSEKQIEKLDKISDFYYNFYLQLENLWLNFEKKEINEKEMQKQFYFLKESERDINRIINEVHKKINKKLNDKAKIECDQFFNRILNT